MSRIGCTLAVVLALCGVARAQDEKKPTEEPRAESRDERDAEKKLDEGKTLKGSVRESEKALLDEVERLKKAVGLETAPPPAPNPQARGRADERKPDQGKTANVWKTCGEPGCEKCSKGQFCKRKAERVHQACTRALEAEGRLKARFVQLRVDYRKLTAFLASESERLARDAENPPESEELSREDRDALKRGYLEMASHLRALGPAYEARFNQIEKNEAAALAQLAVLRSRSSILGDALEVLEATRDLTELREEVKTLETNLEELSGAVDRTLAAFQDLAKTIQVEK